MERWENLLWSRIFRSASGVVSDDLFHEFAVVCLILYDGLSYTFVLCIFCSLRFIL